MKPFILVTIIGLFILVILGAQILIQLTQSQAILAQAEIMRNLVIQQFLTSAAMFLLGGFIGATGTILRVKRLGKPVNTQIHIPHNTQPRLHSPYVTRPDTISPTLVVEDSEQEAIEYESLSHWGW